MTQQLCIYESRLRKLGGPRTAVAVLTNVQRRLAHRLVEKARQDAEAVIRRDRDSIVANIRAYERLFDERGYSCPLSQQFERVERSGLPRINHFVDTLLIGEMSTGLLMGVQDWERILPPLRFDVAEEGETYEGMRGQVVCRENEFVVRDTGGIIASYFQGPDARTAVGKQTKNAVYLGLGLPEMAADKVRGALEVCVGILKPAAESVTYSGQ